MVDQPAGRRHNDLRAPPQHSRLDLHARGEGRSGRGEPAPEGRRLGPAGPTASLGSRSAHSRAGKPAGIPGLR
eukprot:9590-Chlamydomonas_euryale.AAC.1